MRTALLLPILLALLPAAAADGPLAPEPPPPAPVREILAALRSPDSRLVAWAAHHAGRLGVEEAAPLMAARLRFLGRLDPPLRPRALPLVLLDALARMRARPPASALLPYLDGWGGDAVVVILARHPIHYRSTLLDLFEGAAPGTWVREVSGTLLAAARVPGFAFRLLHELPIEVVLSVRDGAVSSAPRPSPDRISPGMRELRLERPTGWPPAAQWSVGRWRRAGDERLAEGPPALHASRREVEAWTWAWHLPTPPPPPWRDVTFPWTERLLPGREDLPRVWTRQHRGIVATGRRPYLRQVRDLRDELLGPYWALARRLLDEGLLTEEEARRLRPAFRLEVEDLRRGWTKPLPALDPAPNPIERARRLRLSGGRPL